MIITVFYNHIEEAMKQNKMSLAKVAKIAKEHGISGIEMDFNEYLNGDKKLLKDLAKVGLPVHSMYRFYDFGNKAMDRSYRQTISVLAKNKIRHHMVIPGFITQTSLTNSKEKQIKRMIKRTDKLCKLAAKKGIATHIEDFDDATSPIATPEGMCRFLNAVSGLTPCFDTGNFLFSELDAEAALDTLIDKNISYVHCKDRSFTRKKGEEPKATVKGRDMYSSPAGQGVIPMEKILTRLFQNEYDGALAVEHFGSQNMLEDMCASADFIRGVYEKVHH